MSYESTVIWEILSTLHSHLSTVINKKGRLRVVLREWWVLTDSNRRPSACKAGQRPCTSLIVNKLC